jgi:HAD superfamily hydrolase (TIGR01509 family)
VIEAVIFDLDGVLVDSEQVWDAARRDVVAAHGGTWKESATTDMLGMSSPEWSRYVVDELKVQLTPEEVNAAVLDAMLVEYDRALPLLPGAREAVFRLADRYPLGLASSSNREIIDLVLEGMGVTEQFMATVSSEEVERGKPAPDVYLEAARRMGFEAAACAAIEDSTNGLRSAHAAGLRVIAIPNPHFPPAEDALALADVTLPDLDALTPAAVGQPARLAGPGELPAG